MLALKTIQRAVSRSTILKQTLAESFVQEKHPQCIPLCHQCFRHSSSSNEKERNCVYYGVLSPQIKAVKGFSLLTSVLGMVAQPILYQQVTVNGGSMSLTIALGSVVGFFTFCTPLLLHTITKKYVTKIIYNAEDGSYTATVITFFMRQKEVRFTPEDVEVPDIPGMFTSFLIKGQPVFVDPRLFPDTSHYAKIMGYDKPIDFSMEHNFEDADKKK